MQDVRQRDEVAKRDAGQKQKNRGRKKASDGAALSFIKGGRDEKPNLVQHPWRGYNDPDVDARGDEQVQVARRMRDDESWLETRVAQRFLHGLGHDADEVWSDEPADGGADYDRNERVNDAFA